MCFLAEYLLLNTHLRLLRKYVGHIHRSTYSIETVRGSMFLFYFIVLIVIVQCTLLFSLPTTAVYV